MIVHPNPSSSDVRWARIPREVHPKVLGFHPRRPGPPIEEVFEPPNISWGKAFRASKHLQLTRYDWKILDVSKNRGVFPKIGKTPQISHLFIGFSIIFTIHFGGKIPLFLVQRPFHVDSSTFSHQPKPFPVFVYPNGLTEPWLRAVCAAWWCTPSSWRSSKHHGGVVFFVTLGMQSLVRGFNPFEKY